MSNDAATLTRAIKILVVDDSDDSRDLTMAALASAGYETLFSAASGSEALRLLGVGVETSNAAAAIDTILLDIVMPDMDGIELCARIRTDKRYDDVPIIMLTSLADADSVASAMAAGADDYLSKPLDRFKLLERIGGVIARRSARRAPG
jgi:CheY-like chemotaxis protein